MKRLLLLLLLPLLFLGGCDNEKRTIEREKPEIQIEMMKNFGVSSEDIEIKLVDIQKRYGAYSNESVSYYEVEIKDRSKFLVSVSKLLVSISRNNDIKIEKVLEEK